MTADFPIPAGFDDWWYGHDGVRQRQVAYLGYPCTKELAASIWSDALAAAPPIAAVVGEPVAWLFEHDGTIADMPVGGPAWACVKPPALTFGKPEVDWTHDTNKALRFSRREDAEAFRTGYLGLYPREWDVKAYRVTEHMWPAPSPATDPAATLIAALLAVQMSAVAIPDVAGEHAIKTATLAKVERALGAYSLSVPAKDRKRLPVTVCCGRSECGGECGNEWAGMEDVSEPPAAVVGVEASDSMAVCPTCGLAGRAIADERDAYATSLPQWKALAALTPSQALPVAAGEAVAWQVKQKVYLDRGPWVDVDRATYEAAAKYPDRCEVRPLYAGSPPTAREPLSEHERDELERLQALVNSPETRDFLLGVRNEVAHQVEKWGTVHDRAKEPADWFWLVGYLGGKALAAHVKGDSEKAMHHCISTSAALANWHAHILHGAGLMQPGSSDLQDFLRNTFGANFIEYQSRHGIVAAPTGEG